MRTAFAWAEIEEVETCYSIAGCGKGQVVRELPIGRGVPLQAAAPQGRLL